MRSACKGLELGNMRHVLLLHAMPTRAGSAPEIARDECQTFLSRELTSTSDQVTDQERRWKASHRIATSQPIHTRNSFVIAQNQNRRREDRYHFFAKGALATNNCVSATKVSTSSEIEFDEDEADIIFSPKELGR